MNQLTCQYQDLKRDSDNRGDDFNALIFFINEIGMNMNAAKDHIFENQEAIQQIQNESSQINFSEMIHTLEAQINSSLALQEERNRNISAKISELESRLNSAYQVIQTLSNQLNSASVSLDVEVEQDDQEVRSVPEQWKSDLENDTRKNSMLIGSNKEAIHSLEHRISSMI